MFKYCNFSILLHFSNFLALSYIPAYKKKTAGQLLSKHSITYEHLSWRPNTNTRAHDKIIIFIFLVPKTSKNLRIWIKGRAGRKKSPGNGHESKLLKNTPGSETDSWLIESLSYGQNEFELKKQDGDKYTK